MDTNLKSALVKILTAYDEKKNDELSKKVNISSILSTVSECTASTNSNDIAGASALAEMNESLPIIEHGILTLTGTGEIVTQTINFAKSFSVKPTVIVSIQRPATTYYFDGKVAVYGVEVDRFSIHSQSPIGIVNIIHWIAIA